MRDILDKAANQQK